MSANPYYRFVWPIQIGTPTQTLYVVFDTGSADFWVYSWQMPISLTLGHSIYNATSSTSSQKFPGQSFIIDYSSGSVYGVVWLDDLWIDSLGVIGNPIEAADNLGGAFSTLPAVDGIMGLNAAINDSESPDAQQTWFDFVLPHLEGKSESP